MNRSFVFIVGTALLLCCAAGSRVKINDKSAEKMRADDPPPLRMSPSTTVNGCTCKVDSKCGTGSVFNGTWFKCDWCRVEGNCGSKAWTEPFVRGGNWDYCEYPKMVKYEEQTADEKMDQLWGEVMDKADQTGAVKSLLGTLSTLVGESMRTSFDTHWDVLPEGRTKVIHSQGVHCKFDLNITANSPYTGLFAPGTQAGIIRMGSASSNDVTGKPPFPGLSFKFLRDGVQSGNFVALRASGQDGDANATDGKYAFFDQHFSKIADPPPALKKMMKFEQASDCMSMVGLSDVCAFAQNGAPAGDSLEFPYDIKFSASSTQVYLKNTVDKNGHSNEKMTDDEMLGHLRDIKKGTHLLNVFALASPSKDAEWTNLGYLTTTTDCVTSAFGDESLFFRHQRMEEDLLKKPKWVDQIDAPGCTAAAVGNEKWQCPGVH